MKRLILAAILMSSSPLFAQEAGSPASAAARQHESAREITERFSRLEADFEQLKADNMSLRDEVSRLRQDLAKVRDESAKTATAVANNNTQDDLKRVGEKLAEKITEVDRKREADKLAISEEIKRNISKLESAIQTLADRPVHREHSTPPPTTPNVEISDTGYSYTIAKGDTLSAIVLAYNAKFKEKNLKTITQAQVKAANPDVKWDRLKTGMTITIPKPLGAPKD